MGRSREAAEYFERAAKIAANFVRQDPNDAESRFAFSDDGIKLAAILRHSDPRRAAAFYDEALGRLAEIKNNSRARRDEVRALAGSTYPLRQIGNTAEARKRLDAAFSRLSELKLYPAEQVEPGSEADKALRALADYEAGKGEIRRGIEIYQELIRKITASKPKPESNLSDAFNLSNIYAVMSALHRRGSQPNQAAELDARRLELWCQWDRKLPNNSFVRRQLRAGQ
jgi:tetratricopeptide (TPR) repeat protein